MADNMGPAQVKRPWRAVDGSLGAVLDSHHFRGLTDIGRVKLVPPHERRLRKQGDPGPHSRPTGIDADPTRP